MIVDWGFVIEGCVLRWMALVVWMGVVSFAVEMRGRGQDGSWS